jgi:gluconolactonase
MNGITSVQLTDGVRIAEGLRFPEGPVAMPDGSVVFTEIAAQRVSRVRPLEGGGWSPVETVADVPGGPNGLALGPDGALYCTNNGGSFTWIERNAMLYPGPRPDTWRGGSIDRIDVATGDVTTIYRGSTETDVTLRGPNDLVFDAHGGFWFTDHGTRTVRQADRTGIWYGRDDGTKCVEVVFPSENPNGIGLSPTGDKVMWAETHTGRAYVRSVTAPGVVAPADPATGGLLAGMPGSVRFDSLAVDAAGNTCIGSLGIGGITSIAPSGDWTHYAMPTDLFDAMTTNICFGGPDLRTAFITQSAVGWLIAVRWPTPGLRLNYC